MAERRKIIIETGSEPDEPLSTPHFDTEATLTARPVVPLSDQEPSRYGDYAGRAARPFWKRPALLVLIVLVAVGIGIAAGIAIGFYRNRGAAQTPVAAAPSSTAESTDSGQVVETPEPESTSQARATVPEKSEDVTEKPEEPTVEPKGEERDERNARNERRDDDEVKPPVVRDKKPVKVDEYIIEDGGEERQAEKERRREERRAERRERRRRQREEEPNLPRQVERAGRELDRIRDIFEGRQP